MSNIWAAVDALDEHVQNGLAEVLETRGAEDAQRVMRDAFLAAIPFVPGSSVLEAGCGTGALTRLIVRLPGVSSVVAVDRAPRLISKARSVLGHVPGLQFVVADARSLPLEGDSRDVAIFDSCLAHVSEPGRAVAEAHRVLRPGGHLAIFDGDYASASVALGRHDPLQLCVDATMNHTTDDRWLTRRLPTLVHQQGFELVTVEGHSYLNTNGTGYMLSVVDRGADLLYQWGRIDSGRAAVLKRQARQRAADGEFFGVVGYLTLVARKR
jgi:ubiquinone/menaquinone biosynthesis C-methylase UbiE